MLQEVHLPLGLVQQASQPAVALNGSTGSNIGSSSSSSKLSVGSRVLVLPRGSWLWQPGEVTAVQQQDPQQCNQPAGGSNGGSSGGSSYTVQLVGQQRILTVGQDSVVSVEAAAAVSDTQLESIEAAADIAATAATAAVAAVGGSSRVASGSTGLAGGSGSDMSFSSEDGGSGGESDDEASSEMEERHLGGVRDVLDHARWAVQCRITEVSDNY
jgi:hypothetical protein